MAAHREIPKKFAREYARADKTDKGRLLDTLVETTGWSRGHARRTIRGATKRNGAAREITRRARPRQYSYDAPVVVQEVWQLSRSAVGQVPGRDHGRHVGAPGPPR